MTSQSFIVAAVVSAVITVIYYVLFKASYHQPFWDAQPCPGRKDQVFSWTRAVLRAFGNSQAMVNEGYAKYSKKGRIFVLPSMSISPVVILPPSQLTVLDKPLPEIDADNPQIAQIQFNYTVRDSHIYSRFLHLNVTRKQLTRNFASFTEELSEEVALAFDTYWGSSTEYKEVTAWKTILKITARVSNRLFVGPEICRNEAFLQNAETHSISIFGGAAVINMFPEALRPIFGPLIGLLGRRPLSVCKKILVPVIESRMEAMQRQTDEDESALPDDALQWLIDECISTNDPHQLKPSRIAHTFLLLNLVSVHSTSFTLTNVLLDLYSSPDAPDYLSALQKECTSALQSGPQGHWTRHKVAKLTLVDSTIRESMRISSFGIVALPRCVASQKGLHIAGELVPQGTRLGVAMEAIHRDSAHFADPLRYNAFRFARDQDFDKDEKTPNRLDSSTSPDREVSRYETSNYETRHNADLMQEKESSQHPDTTPRTGSRGLVDLDDRFLGFGYGKHACPGRFFAAHIMKLILAYVVLNYDIEQMPQRPEPQVIMETKLPSEKTTLRVRKRVVRW